VRIFAEDNVFATSESSVVGTLHHFDGFNWTQLYGNPEVRMFDIWALADNDVYAVGGGLNQGVLVHVDGHDDDVKITERVFERADLPSPASTFLQSVWKGDDTLYLAGPNVRIEIDDQGESTIINIAGPVRDIWGTSADNVFAVGWTLGGGFIDRRDANGWSRIYDSPTGLNGIWGAAADDIYAVGLEGTVVHFDGSGWSPVQADFAGTLWTVWGSGPADIYVGGQNGIGHFDGSSWLDLDSPIRVTELAGLERSFVTAIAAGEIHSMLGSAWAFAEPRDPTDSNEPDVPANFNAFAISVDDTGKGFSVGASGELRSIDNLKSRFEGTLEVAIPSLWVQDEVAIVVGQASFSVNDGRAHVFDGTPREITPPGAPPLTGIWGDGSAVVVTGVDGFVSTFDGSNWVSLGAPTWNYRSVWGRALDDLFVAGADPGTGLGLLMHFDGTTWTEIGEERFPAAATSVWASGEELFVGLLDGGLHRFDGTAWHPSFVSLTSQVMSIGGSSGDDIFAVTVSGDMARFDGSLWSRVRLPVQGVGSVQVTPTRVVLGGVDGYAFLERYVSWTPAP
jgi:hypothetical protein